MKYFGSVCAFAAERNADIMRAFRLCLAQADYIVMPEIFEKVSLSPASRFWVSEERALAVVSRMIAGKPLRPMRPTKLEMFSEICARVVALRCRRPQASLPELVAEVISQPAPKFYLSPRSVGEFIYRIKKGWYEKGPRGARR